MAFIQGGTFEMGSLDGEADETPRHPVTLEAFYLDRTEVTNAEFRKFVEATGYTAEGRWSRYAGTGRDAHPVVSVTWNDAAAYAKWAGKRLPTEAEWEYAARAGRPAAVYGTGGMGTDLSEKTANFGHTQLPMKPPVLEGISTLPVGTFEPNPFGLSDMSGNAAEWCADWYASDYYGKSPKETPTGPTFGRGRAVRGGSWNDPAKDLRLTRRIGLPAGSIAFVLGFRCAADVPRPQKPSLWSRWFGKSAS